MTTIIRLCVCLIYLTTTCGFVMTLSTSNISKIKTTKKQDIGYLCNFETVLVYNADGSKSKTSKNIYKQIKKGITIYTTITEDEFIHPPSALDE